jgi:ribosomal protein S18 acetylase RimI-like enzyme
MTWTIRLLAAGDARDDFESGNAVIDRWFREDAWNYVAKRFATVHLAVSAQYTIDGFYSFNARAVALDLLPKSEHIRFPRHPVPVAHIGRLARHVRVKGQRLGEDLVVDAIRRAKRLAATDLAVAAIEVIAIDEHAKSFYSRLGFVSLLDDPRHMYLSMKTADKLNLG